MNTPRCNLAGIDVSAKWLVVAMSRNGKIHQKKFANEMAGHKELIRWLRPSNKVLGRVCLEATGLYHLEACLALHQSSICCCAS